MIMGSDHVSLRSRTEDIFVLFREISRVPRVRTFSSIGLGYGVLMVVS